MMIKDEEIELLHKVVIPKYPRVIKVSNARKIKPFIKGKSKVPKKYQNSGYEWRWVKRTKKGTRTEELHLFDVSTGEKVPANPSTAGKPKYDIISGNALYSLNMYPMVRDKIVQEIQVHFMRYIDEQIPKSIDKFPLIIRGLLYDTYTDEVSKADPDWDVDNRQFFYNKAFLDTLVGIKVYHNKQITTKGRAVIPDDHRGYVTGPPSLVFTPIVNSEDRKIIYYIYHDKRKILQSHGRYNELHNLGGAKLNFKRK